MKIKKYRKVSKKPRRKSLNKSRKKKRVKKGGSNNLINPKKYKIIDKYYSKVTFKNFIFLLIFQKAPKIYFFFIKVRDEKIHSAYLIGLDNDELINAKKKYEENKGVNDSRAIFMAQNMITKGNTDLVYFKKETEETEIKCFSFNNYFDMTNDFCIKYIIMFYQDEDFKIYLLKNFNKFIFNFYELLGKGEDKTTPTPSFCKLPYLNLLNESKDNLQIIFGTEVDNKLSSTEA
jgi:hypothetical protein